MKTFITIFFFATFCFQKSYSQNKISFEKKNFSIKQSTISSPKNASPSFNARIKNITPPTPDGKGAKAYLAQQKIKSRIKYPITSTNQKEKRSVISGPILGKEFGLNYHTKKGKPRLLNGGNPTDNTLAVSNNGIVLTALNSNVYAYDLNKDTLALENNYISLNKMANNTNPDNYYFDPKLIYDEIANRFILVFLRNNSPATNKIIVCFSTTDNPNDDWNVYELPGNPLNNNRWTDFPAISMTDSNLYITGNLIIPNTSWQIGFDGSIIWEINKESGYNDSVDLNSTLYNDIKFDGKFIRNLHTVTGADGKIDQPYFLSNRNFAIENDTIFLLSLIKDELADTNTLDIKFAKTDLKYGVPPNARQEGTDTSDPTRGLQTNDARVLAAIKVGSQIQFVSNTVNPATGFSAIYHGKITDLNTPVVTGSIISDPKKDFGYPNIAWTGNEDCDIETIIAFNHTSPTDFPGISCVYYSNDEIYSDVVILKEGDGYVNKLGNGYERWGDYFGLQRKHNEPGKVYSFGFYGTSNNNNSGWCNEIISPDSNKLSLKIKHDNSATFCNQTITVDIQGGVPPYVYLWENDEANTSSTSRTLCNEDSVNLKVTDSRGCELSETLFSKTVFTSNPTNVFPNPFSDQIAFQFSLEKDAMIKAYISDSKGTTQELILNQQATQGQNEINFNLAPLGSGIYFLRLMADGKEILLEKIIKN